MWRLGHVFSVMVSLAASAKIGRTSAINPYLTLPYNVGFCKIKGDCAYYHADKVCDQFLTDGKWPQSKTCLLWHPKRCKFWLGAERGCLRGQDCKYLYKLENKGNTIKIDINQSKHNEQNEQISSTKPKKNYKRLEKIVNKLVKTWKVQIMWGNLPWIV